MGRTINEVHLKGRAGKDAEVKYTASGKQLVKFSLATDGGKSKEGKEYRTNWHNIQCWDLEGAEYVRKGAEVELTGRIDYQSWEGTDGQKKYMTAIVAQHIQLEGADDPERNYPQQQTMDIREEDIPF